MRTRVGAGTHNEIGRGKQGHLEKVETTGVLPILFAGAWFDSRAFAPILWGDRE